MNGRPDPASDAWAFLTAPHWPTPVFWLLLLASCGLAVLVWRRDATQRTARMSAAGCCACWSARCGGSSRYGRYRPTMTG